MHFWPKFGNADFNWWWLIARTSSKWGKFWLLSSIWPWSSRSIAPGNNRDLNQGLLHLWSKFGDSSLNSWLVIARTSWWLTDRHTHTHTQATTIPEGHNWPRVKMDWEWLVDCIVPSHYLNHWWLIVNQGCRLRMKVTIFLFKLHTSLFIWFHLIISLFLSFQLKISWHWLR